MYFAEGAWSAEVLEESGGEGKRTVGVKLEISPFVGIKFLGLFSYHHFARNPLRLRDSMVVALLGSSSWSRGLGSDVLGGK